MCACPPGPPAEAKAWRQQFSCGTQQSGESQCDSPDRSPVVMPAFELCISNRATVCYKPPLSTTAAMPANQPGTAASSAVQGSRTSNASCAGEGGNRHSQQHNRQHSKCRRVCAAARARLRSTDTWAGLGGTRVPGPTLPTAEMAAGPTWCTERHPLQTAQGSWCLALSAPATGAQLEWQDIGWLGCEILPT